MDQGKDHQAILGPLHVHQFNELLGCLVKSAREDEKLILETLISQIKDVHYLVPEVKILQTSNMHESKYRRLEIRVERQEAELAVVDGKIVEKPRPTVSPATAWPIMKRVLLRESACKELPGMAPAGANARSAQKRLDKR